MNGHSGGRADVAVVIPCLDEAGALGGLLGDLAAQRGVSLEVVVVDGGSSDGTVEVAETLSLGAPFRLTVLRTSRGRALQLNAGAEACGAAELLFLHADCRVDDPDLLARARAALLRERGTRRHDRVAGHFALRFLRSVDRPSLAYYYYEAKAAQSRPECVNGDQGFWFSRPYFEALGGFDESATLLEDARLADRVFETGVWVTLPGTLGTSARRFEAEGFLERQTLNALLRAFAALELPAFFSPAAELYRVQPRAVSLELAPFFQAAHRAVWGAGAREGIRRWLRVGSYVRSQAWQVAFWFDCRLNFRRGLRPGRGPSPRLEAYDLWVGAPRRRVVLDAAAAALTAGWLYAGLAWSLVPVHFRRRGPRNSP